MPSRSKSDLLLPRARPSASASFCASGWRRWSFASRSKRSASRRRISSPSPRAARASLAMPPTTPRTGRRSSRVLERPPSPGSTANKESGTCMVFLPDYAELHCLSNFSFLRGASHPEELVERAKSLGYAALALTDECSFAGAVRAHIAAKELGLKLVLGTEVVLKDGVKLIVLATDRRSYGAICALITTGRRRSKKGCYSLLREDVQALTGSGALVLWVPGEDVSPANWVAQHFKGHAWIAVELHCGPNDHAKLQGLRELSRQCGLPLAAAGDVHVHLRSRRRLQDVLTAIRLKRPVSECGQALFPNAERSLRLRMRLAQ